MTCQEACKSLPGCGGAGTLYLGERQPLYAEEGKFQLFEVGGWEAALLVAQGDERQQAAVVSKEQTQDAE